MQAVTFRCLAQKYEKLQLYKNILHNLTMDIAFTVVINMLKKRFSGIETRFYVQFCYLRVEK